MKTIKCEAVRVLLCNIVFMLCSIVAIAQNEWSLNFRPGVNFATKNLGDAKLKTGFGFDGTLGYKLTPQLGAYAGWSWNKFSAGQSFAGTKKDFDVTGYNFGLQLFVPIATSDVKLVVGGGAIYNHIEVENTNGDIIADSGHGWGWQLDAGLMLKLSEHINFVPGIRYRALSRDLKVGAATTAVNLNYFSVGAGFAWTF